MKIIGIDLGTTNSCAAFYEGKQVTVIPSPEGHRTTPSVVAFTPNGIRVGEAAKRQAIINPLCTISSVKRYMGERTKDLQLDAHPCSYPLASSPEGNVVIPIGDKFYTPQEISAYILQKLKKAAESFSGEDVRDVVITVPAYFSEKQRQATKEAGTIAGLNVIRIINEPTAAALAYGIENGAPGKVVVFDLGGGTFDISVLDCFEGLYEVLATSGNTHLGGDDFDRAIMNWLIDVFKKENDIDLWQYPDAVQRIKEAAERAKIELSSIDFTEINIPYLVAVNDKPFHMCVTLTRSHFEILVRPLVDACYEPCRMAMKSARLQQHDIDRVLLVGGSTRMPLIHRMVHDFFGIDPTQCPNPEEIVAMGAAWQGALLNRDYENVIMMDVTPLSLGIQIEGGLMSTLIHANETIPITREGLFSNAVDNQEAVTIRILQGEGQYAKLNRLIGTFILSGIQPAPAGESRIRVTFDMNKDGLLTVSAVDEKTGSSNSLCVHQVGNLSDKDIDRMRSEVSTNEVKEERRILFLNNLRSIELLIHRIRGLLSNKNRHQREDDQIRFESLVRKFELTKSNENPDELHHIGEKIRDFWDEISDGKSFENY